MMDVHVGVEGSERGRKRRNKAGEEVDMCFGSGQTVSASFGVRYISDTFRSRHK